MSEADAARIEELMTENAKLQVALNTAREALLIISGQHQCADNLMSNLDVALEALRLIKG